MERKAAHSVCSLSSVPTTAAGTPRASEGGHGWEPSPRVREALATVDGLQRSALLSGAGYRAGDPGADRGSASGSEGNSPARSSSPPSPRGEAAAAAAAATEAGAAASGLASRLRAAQHAYVLLEEDSDAAEQLNTSYDALLGACAVSPDASDGGGSAAPSARGPPSGQDAAARAGAAGVEEARVCWAHVESAGQGPVAPNPAAKGPRPSLQAWARQHATVQVLQNPVSLHAQERERQPEVLELRGGTPSEPPPAQQPQQPQPMAPEQPRERPPDERPAQRSEEPPERPPPRWQRPREPRQLAEAQREQERQPQLQPHSLPQEQQAWLRPRLQQQPQPEVLQGPEEPAAPRQLGTSLRLPLAALSSQRAESRSSPDGSPGSSPWGAALLHCEGPPARASGRHASRVPREAAAGGIQAEAASWAPPAEPTPAQSPDRARSLSPCSRAASSARAVGHTDPASTAELPAAAGDSGVADPVPTVPPWASAICRSGAPRGGGSPLFSTPLWGPPREAPTAAAQGERVGDSALPLNPFDMSSSQLRECAAVQRDGGTAAVRREEQRAEKRERSPAFLAGAFGGGAVGGGGSPVRGRASPAEPQGEAVPGLRREPSAPSAEPRRAARHGVPRDSSWSDFTGLLGAEARTAARAGGGGGPAPAGAPVDPAEVRLEEPLGSGSTAEVYRGTWHGTDVAVKKLKRSGKLSQEFTRELTVLLRLRHPNLVLFMGAATCASPPMIVSEFCAGGTVFSLLHQRREVTLSWSQRLKIAVDVAKGMNFLHWRQVVHRDLKSLNLLLSAPVSRHDEVPLVKVADFGLSRAWSGDAQSKAQTCMTSGAGTYHWMAPEVLDGHSYDEKIDVYSYGICIYELLTRRIPYDGSGLEPVSIAVAVSRGRRPDTAHVPRDCPADLRFTMESAVGRTAQPAALASTSSSRP
ncbi:unnamed protein product [Prorocentrum cordatum]|uniref:Protein kinase domain-containing protein n=1 Tax=Prorocentrum cordatum TaxID=2364126 RepID=A0ABN9Q5Q4_9DINO|nr:unnamed protein product [Polarella glacialis]